MQLRTHNYKVNMVPLEDLILIEDTIRKCIDNNTIDNIADAVGPMYYSTYKKDIDALIEKIMNE